MFAPLYFFHVPTYVDRDKDKSSAVIFLLIVNRFANASATSAKHDILTIHDHYPPRRSLLKMSDSIAGL